MGELIKEVNLQVVSQIKGYDEQMTAVTLGVVIPPEIDYMPEADMIVEVNLTIEDQPVQEIHIVQKLPPSAISETIPHIIRLEGVLWLKGIGGRVNILASSADIYYTQAV